jgi:plastocyanin
VTGRSRRHPLVSGLVVVVIGLATAACGAANDSAAPSARTTPSASPSPTSSPRGSVGAATGKPAGASHHAVTITITDFAYDVSGTVEPGSMVMVTNRDSEAHTVTADSKKAFDVKVDPGATVMLEAPDAPGTYRFHCTYHSNMEGLLRVG